MHSVLTPLMIKFKNTLGSDCSTLPLSSFGCLSGWPSPFWLGCVGQCPLKAFLHVFWEMEPGQHEKPHSLVEEYLHFENRLGLHLYLKVPFIFYWNSLISKSKQKLRSCKIWRNYFPKIEYLEQWGVLCCSWRWMQRWPWRWTRPGLGCIPCKVVSTGAGLWGRDYLV